MKKAIIMLLVKLRWVYFHVHPGYQKFYMTNEEAHFFHEKTNSIHSNFKWIDAQDKS